MLLDKQTQTLQLPKTSKHRMQQQRFFTPVQNSRLTLLLCMCITTEARTTLKKMISVHQICIVSPIKLRYSAKMGNHESFFKLYIRKIVTVTLVSQQRRT